MRAAAIVMALAASGCGQSLVDFFVVGGEDLAVENPDLASGDLARADLATVAVDGAADGALDVDLLGSDAPLAADAGDDLASVDMAIANDMTGTCSAVLLGGGDDLVIAPDQAHQDPAGALTVEAWIYPTALPASDQVIVAHWDPTMANRHSYRLRIDATGHVVFDTRILTTERSVQSTAALTTGAWHHVAGVFSPDAANASMRAFVDGNGNALTGFAGVQIGGGANDGLAMGNLSDGSAPFAGYMSDVRVQAAALYSANFTPPSTVAPDAMTIALYHMNETSGLVAADSATGANRPNNAALQNGAAFMMPPSCR